MDSPFLQSPPSSHQRLRTTSSLSATSSVDRRGAVQKRRDPTRDRSISLSQVDRLQRLALDQVHAFPYTTSVPLNWITPEHSPPHDNIFAQPSINSFPTWTVPTPPGSDSGVPSVSIGPNDEPVTCSPQDFQFGSTTASSEMSSLGFLLPSQYGSGPYESEPSNYAMDHSYIPPMRVSQPPSTSGSSTYGQTGSSSPALYQSRPDLATRRQSEMPRSGVNPAYDDPSRRISSPYHSTAPTSNYSMASGQTIPSISGLTQSPSMGSSSGSPTIGQYATKSSNPYESNVYGQSYSTGPPASGYEGSSHSHSYPPSFSNSMTQVGSKPPMRVPNQKQKPQCWEHNCNGRQFSTFSNLLRHQRERSGTASKSYCPRCNAEFTRTTARNGHLAHDKCTKQGQPSEDEEK